MTNPEEKSFADRAAEEIDALHRVLQAWFRAEGESDPKVVLDRFDERFRMVGASGNVIDYAQFAAGLPKLRGSRPTLVLEISDVEVLDAQEDKALVVYRERQHQDTGSTERWSSALLIKRADRPTPVHVHVQETFSSASSERR